MEPRWTTANGQERTTRTKRGAAGTGDGARKCGRLRGRGKRGKVGAQTCSVRRPGKAWEESSGGQATQRNRAQRQAGSETDARM